MRFNFKKSIMIENQFSLLKAEIKKINPKAKIVAVTKERTTQEIKDLIKAGATIIGENKIQEAQKKFSELKLTRIEKHFIGHLQRNKVALAVSIFDLIQSVDSWKLLEKINEEAVKIKKTMPIFLQVNSVGDNRQGFKMEEILDVAAKIKNYPNVKLKGLMTVGAFASSTEESGEYFAKMRSLFQICQAQDLFYGKNPQLSMGMSGDYKSALKKGSTMVRIGGALFRLSKN